MCESKVAYDTVIVLL